MTKYGIDPGSLVKDLPLLKHLMQRLDLFTGIILGYRRNQ